MRVLIAGGAGFVGGALANHLRAVGHDVWILSRAAGGRPAPGTLRWDGKTSSGWAYIVDECDAIINMCGKALSSWPWTARQKRAFINSRVEPGRALVEAVRAAARPPRVLLQISGIGYYGPDGGTADESTPAGRDYISSIPIEMERATEPVREIGTRHIALRSAVVLARDGGSLPFVALPMRLFFGGPIGTGSQAMNWIHSADFLSSIRFLLEHDSADGPFNLIAPAVTTNAEFMRALAAVLHRPSWFRVPAWLLQLLLGEMSDLMVKGRPAEPRRLRELGYRFQFERLEAALQDLFRKQDKEIGR